MKKIFLIILIIGIGIFYQAAPIFAQIGISYSFDYIGSYAHDEDFGRQIDTTEIGFGLGLEYLRQIETIEIGAGIEWQKLRGFSFSENNEEFGFISGYGMGKFYLREPDTVSYNLYLLGRIGYGVLIENQYRQKTGGFYYAIGLGAKGDFEIFNWIELLYSANQAMIETDLNLKAFFYNKMSIVIGMVL